jgi:hypothetical protein
MPKLNEFEQALPPDWREEGSVCFWLNHPIAKNWTADNRSYRFPALLERSVTAQARKHPDKRIECIVTIPGREPVQLGGRIPQRSLPNTICVDIFWKGPVVSLRLDAVLAAQSVPRGSAVIPFKR